MWGTRKRAAQTAASEAYGKSIPDILAIIKDSYSELRPAERRVADVVLADVTFAVDASNGDIAKRSETSEPTVTRFCRAIGCAGVRDFKLKPAQSTVVGRLYLDVPKEGRLWGDRSPLWKEVFSEARAALAVVEDMLSPADVLKAAELISAARPVMISASEEVRRRSRRKSKTGCSATVSSPTRTPTPMSSR